jgi:hypothetical protein
VHKARARARPRARLRGIARRYVAVQWPYAYEMQNTCLAALHMPDSSRDLSRFSITYTL